MNQSQRIRSMLETELATDPLFPHGSEMDAFAQSHTMVLRNPDRDEWNRLVALSHDLRDTPLRFILYRDSLYVWAGYLIHGDVLQRMRPKIDFEAASWGLLTSGSTDDMGHWQPIRPDSITVQISGQSTSNSEIVRRVADILNGITQVTGP